MGPSLHTSHLLLGLTNPIICNRSAAQYTAERDALQAARLEREQRAGQAQRELEELERLIEEEMQINAKYQEELPLAREDLESKMRDKEEAKRLNERAHDLMDTL
ncbi:unnamed protein product [Effrenium voratum]|nr:unnamed protein product [Effrenium voratum]